MFELFLLGFFGCPMVFPLGFLQVSCIFEDFLRPSFWFSVYLMVSSRLALGFLYIRRFTLGILWVSYSCLTTSRDSSEFHVGVMYISRFPLGFHWASCIFEKFLSVSSGLPSGGPQGLLYI